MHRVRLAAAPVALALLVAACGGDSTGPGPDPRDGLDPPEIVALADAVLGLTLGVGFGSHTSVRTFPTAALAAAPVSVDFEAEFEADCPLGGTMDVAMDLEGVTDPETGAGDLTMTLTETPRSCVVRHDASGRRFTLDGAPNVVFVIDLVSDASGAASLSGTYEGAVAWATDDGRGGTCAFDVAFTGEGGSVIGRSSGTMRGSVCGVAVDHAWSTDPAA